MRVTNQMMYNDFLYNLNNINTQMQNTSLEVSSGKKIVSLSTNPVALTQLLSLKDLNSRLDQYITNINNANGLLNVEDNSLSSMISHVEKASSLLIQAENATNSKNSNDAIAQNLSSILNELHNDANAMFEGKYIFSGYKINTKPIGTKTQTATVLNPDNTNIELKTAAAYSDINQLKNGDYTIKIQNGMLSLLNANGTIIPIDADGKDESNVGGNTLSTSINISGKSGQWFDTGRGLIIKIPITTSNVNVSINYGAGGQYIYQGDNGKISATYSDDLSSPITLTAKDIFKPTNQTLENNNFMVDKTTNDPVVEQTKLTNIVLKNALQKVSLDTGYTIEVNGTDHNGNMVRGSFTATSNATLQNFTDFIDNLNAYQVLKNNKTFIINNTFASASTKLSSLGITSNINFSGLNHTGVSVNTTFTNSTNATLSSLDTFISSKFDVSASIAHGQIVISDNQNGPSKLNIIAKTIKGNPVLGVFNTISNGSCGGLTDTTNAFIKNGHLFIEDERRGKSDLNLTMTIKNKNGSIKPNIFGVLNVYTEGGGVDIFESLQNAVESLKNNQSGFQIGKLSDWVAGSTLKPTITGTYQNGINDTWTISASKGGNLMQVGNSVTLSVESRDTSNINKTIATVKITVNNDNTYTIETTNQNGQLIYRNPRATKLDGIVLETENPSPSFGETSEGINGTAGLTLNLDNINGLTPQINQGDFFSFNISDDLQKTIGKSEDALNQIQSARAIVGSMENRFNLAQNRIQTTQLSTKTTISQLEDANIAKIITLYQQELIALQATLQVGAHINKMDLFNYL